MNDIIKKPLIPDGSLKVCGYFTALCEAAANVGLINEYSMQQLQIRTLELLDSQIRSYTNDSTTSVPSELAKELMDSVFYCIGLALREYRTPEEGVSALLNNDILALFGAGRQLAKKKLSDFKNFFPRVLRENEHIKSQAYEWLVQKEVPLYVRKYNPVFFAHMNPDFVTYPLCYEHIDAEGIEYAREYIDRLYYENKFISYFDTKAVLAVLSSYSKSYRSVVFNLFSVVFQTALGCVIANRDPRELFLTRDDNNNNLAVLTGMDSTGVEKLLLDASQALFDIVGARGVGMKKYICQCLTDITPVVMYGIKIGNLNNIFVSYDDTKKKGLE